MTELLTEYGMFLAKTLTFVVAIVVVALALFSMVRHAREMTGEHLEVRDLSDRLRGLGDTVRHALLPSKAVKQLHKDRKAEAKRRDKAGTQRPRLFVIDFRGDLHASAVASLREEVSAVVQVLGEHDEVLVRLESEGGVVHGYGLAASQLRRIKGHGATLTVAVDKVAASGGYLMASVADRILAAPFAILGSIGVVGQMPNFNRLLKRHDVDYELHTAGDFKRTLTLFGENTDAARDKFREELDEAHALFKAFVSENRPQLGLERVATGEHWFGTRALELGLVDELVTSDDYLLKRSADVDLFELRWRRRRTLLERLGGHWSRLRATFGGRGASLGGGWT